MDRPILFSGPMVNAILDGRKTMTRRVVKQPFNIVNFESGPWPFNGTEKKCPYGHPGDRLWVRETWHNHNTHWTPEKPNQICYRANGGQCAVRWRSSIHMPRWASRITLEITGVRVERLQEIKKLDVVKEGLTDWEIAKSCGPFNALVDLWDSINGKKYPWVSNPWVWVVEFKKSQPVNSNVNYDAQAIENK